MELDVSGFTYGAACLTLLGLDVGAEIEDARGDVGDPCVKPRLVFDGYTHDPANHVDRQRVGELVAPIDAGFARRIVEQLVDDPLTHRLQIRNQVRRIRWPEKAHALTARPIVFRWILCDEARLLPVGAGNFGGLYHGLVRDLAILPGRWALFAKVGTYVWVMGQRHELLVTGHGVDAAGHTDHRRLAKFVEEWVRVRAVFVPQRGVKGFFGGHWRLSSSSLRSASSSARVTTIPHSSLPRTEFRVPFAGVVARQPHVRRFGRHGPPRGV